MFNLSRFVIKNNKKFISTCKILQTISTPINENKSEIQEKLSYEDDKRLTEDLKDNKINISTKYVKKFPARKALMKNFFLGYVDTDLLAYPEAISREYLEKLKVNIKINENYFYNKHYAELLESSKNKIPEILIKDLAEQKLFGANILQSYGGIELGITETNLLSEIESNECNLSQLLNTHRLVTLIISEYGSEKLKQKYLTKLANGEITATVAIFESQSTEDGLFNTSINIDGSEKYYIINGEKSYVQNGPQASLYLVFATGFTKNDLGELKKGLSAILIDGDNINILKKESNPTFGNDKLKQSSILFNEVKVPCENLLGDLGKANDIAIKYFNHSRILDSIQAITLMKNILKDLTEYSIKTQELGQSIMEKELIKERLARINNKIYVAESMIYFTSSLIDLYEKQDIELETASIKVFCLESLFNILKESIDTKGVPALFSNGNLEKLYRESSHLMTQGETLDNLKILIGLSGLQYAGLHMEEIVKKLRNPAFYPEFIFGRVFNRKNFDEPKLTLKLNEFLHPSLELPAGFLEASIMRLYYSTDILLSRYGAHVIKKDIETKRICEAVMLIYSMFATLSRASRSYCIGLRDADYEIIMAAVYCIETAETVKKITVDLSKGPFMMNDDNYIKLGDKVLSSKGYFAQHPTTYNY